MKKIVLLILLASIPSVQAENWVYSRDKALMYDTDSIVRKGIFAEMNLSEFGSVRFDCAKNGFLRISSPTAMQEGWREVHKGFPHRRGSYCGVQQAMGVLEAMKVIIGAVLGGFLGSSVGIVGFGGGISGMIPGAILGAIIGAIL